MVDLIHAHGGQLCVCEFEQYFDVKQPTISHHLKVLREAGLIRSCQKGAWVYHAIEPAVFARLRRSWTVLPRRARHRPPRLPKPQSAHPEPDNP